MLALDMKVGCKCLKFDKHQSKTRGQKEKSVFLAKHKNSILLMFINPISEKFHIYMEES